MAGGILFAICGMLLFGTGTSVSMKIMLQLKAAGYKGKVHNFDQPFTQSILMFFGMLFSFFVSKCWDPENKGPRPKSSWRQRVMVAIPSSFDLFASTLMTFGLIYINVSIFQMLRGSMVIFSVIFSIIFLKRKIKGYEYFGVALTVIALVMIGTAGIYIPEYKSEGSTDEDTKSDAQKVMGSLLIIASQAVQAGQIVVEEYVLKDVNMPALEIVGWEGIWGFIMMILVAYPFAFIVPGEKPSPLGTSLEFFGDAFIQLFTNGKIALTCFLFIIAVLFYNMFGMLVTSHSSAIYRTILEAARTLLIWIVMLILAACDAPFGEVWCKYSWLELCGFIVLVCSSFIYGGYWKLPFFKYPEPDYQ